MTQTRHTKLKLKTLKKPTPNRSKRLKPKSNPEKGRDRHTQHHNSRDSRSGRSGRSGRSRKDREELTDSADSDTMEVQANTADLTNSDQTPEPLSSPTKSTPTKDSFTDTDSLLIIRRAHLIGNSLCLIRRTPDESLDVYHRRIGYISKKIRDPDSNSNISDLANNSIIWRNHEIYGMGYPSTVLRRL